MKKYLQSDLLSTGLAVFSMFFGAGNLIYPISVGMMGGDKNIWAISGFLVTAALLPVLGLYTMTLFDGNYMKFFGRVGKVPGFLLIFLCMLMLGPLIAMPRIVSISHTMLTPFLPNFITPLYFGIIFLFFTFLATYKENNIVDFLGKIVSPLLILSLVIILIKGLLFRQDAIAVDASGLALFWNNLKYGYNTMDLLGGIYFASIVITIIKQKAAQKSETKSNKQLAMFSLKAGVIGASLLAIVYVGMSYLAVFNGHNLGGVNPGELFRIISERVLGQNGALIISTAVLMACYSTIIALAAILAEFLQKQIFADAIGYVPSLIITLVATLIPAHFGLSSILAFSEPLIYIFYPVFIAITLFNAAYKLFDFKPIKIPVLVVFLVSLFFNAPMLLKVIGF